MEFNSLKISWCVFKQYYLTELSFSQLFWGKIMSTEFGLSKQYLEDTGDTFMTYCKSLRI